jgi:exosortase K
VTRERPPGVPITLADALTVAGMLGLVWLAKQFYAQATVEELRWILGPSAALAGVLAGTSFDYEAGSGYVSLDLRFTIVPACAGVNFLIVAFCSLLSLVGLGVAGLGRRTVAVVSSAGLAYVVTVVANGTRIAIAAGVHLVGASWETLDVERLHRLEGVAVYVLALLALCEIARVVRRSADGTS